MKTHASVDAATGLTYIVAATSARVAGVIMTGHLMRADDKGYSAMRLVRHVEASRRIKGYPVSWVLCRRQARHHQAGGRQPPKMLLTEIKKATASISAKMEPHFMSSRTSSTTGRFARSGLAKKPAQRFTLFVLGNQVPTGRYQGRVNGASMACT